jgi:hypothetical protein
MSFIVIISLITVLVAIAIIVSAIQQHRARQEAARRAEVAKLKNIISETEQLLMVVPHFSVSSTLVYILNKRIDNALLAIRELNPSMLDLQQRMKESEARLSEIDLEAPAPSEDIFVLPDNDKAIIQYIQSAKRLRAVLRSEHHKGKVETQAYVDEDARLQRIQLRINVDTLLRRADVAFQGGMLGSARQYLEKALVTLENHPKPDEYIAQRKAQIAHQLAEINDTLRNINSQEAKKVKRSEKEKDELDELFAPKKKW